MSAFLRFKSILFQENSKGKSGAEFAIISFCKLRPFSLSPSLLIITFRDSFCQSFLEMSCACVAGALTRCGKRELLRRESIFSPCSLLSFKPYPCRLYSLVQNENRFIKGSKREKYSNVLLSTFAPLDKEQEACHNKQQQQRRTPL